MLMTIGAGSLSAGACTMPGGRPEPGGGAILIGGRTPGIPAHTQFKPVTLMMTEGVLTSLITAK